MHCGNLVFAATSSFNTNAIALFETRLILGRLDSKLKVTQIRKKTFQNPQQIWNERQKFHSFRNLRAIFILLIEFEHFKHNSHIFATSKMNGIIN